MGQSLLGAGNPLAVVESQRLVLRPTGRFPAFASHLSEKGNGPLRSLSPTVLQVNVGRMCNQTCKHCHVDAGPDRQEIMSRAVMQDCLNVLQMSSIPAVDITGGAPEMNPDFRWFVQQIRALGRSVIDRCNLTILMVPRYTDLPEFLAEANVEIIASLPYYSAGNTDRQRGDGVYEKSIAALQRLNAVGYGQPGAKLKLHLVYNPAGAFLPGSQAELQATFKQQLQQRHGIVFHDLLVITNQPINRFLDFLLQSGNYEAYMERLINAYNPATIDGLMCRTTLSVGWDGQLYDCDFNQMLDLPLAPGSPKYIADVVVDRLQDRTIVTGLHCFACTAGAGSSCGGALV